MSSIDFLINPDEFTYINAPLKMLNETQLREINAEMVKNKFCTGITIVPHLFNKTAFINAKTANETKCGGIVGKLNEFSNAYFVNHLTPLGLGKLKLRISDIIATYDPKDYVLYYELGLVKDYLWANVTEQNPSLYDNVCFLMTGYGAHTLGGTGDISSVSPNDTLRQLCCIKSPNQNKPIPNHNYDNWYYVKSIRLYTREHGATKARTTAPSGVCPCVVWDVVDYADRQGGKTVQINGNFNAFINLDFRYQGVDFPSLWQLGEWLCAHIYRIDDVLRPTYIDRNTQYELWHKSAFPESIKFLVCEGRTDQERFVDLLGGATNESGASCLWCLNAQSDTPPSNTNNAILAFKSDQDFLNLMRDFGITRITNDKTTAQNLPSDLFPDDGVVPGGGSSSGYDNDPTIPNIPSFSDNTTDIIDVVTPNITSINAASAYALNLANVKQLFNWLMTNSFLDNISNLFSDKLSAINDLKIMPFDIVNHDTAHTEYSDTLTLANVSGDIACYRILAGYNYIVNGGSYRYTAYWGDYNDYTAASYHLYLPYAGITELSPSNVVNCEISIKYAVDIMTGNATAVIYSDGVFIKMIPCQIGQSVPITFTNTNQRDIKNALAALNIAGNVAGVAASAAAGNVSGAVMGGLGVVGDVARAGMTNPLKYGSSGNFASGTALLMPQTPFLIITRTQLSIPSNIAQLAGKPSNIYSTVNNFVGSGFVRVDVSHINTAATTDEQNQIINLLRGGIFI